MKLKRCMNHATLAEADAQGCSIKNSVLRNVAKFTGKHLCKGLFLMKLQASGL